MAQSATRNPVPDPPLREGMTSAQSAGFDAAAKGSAGSGLVVLLHRRPIGRAVCLHHRAFAIVVRSLLNRPI